MFQKLKNLFRKKSDPFQSMAIGRIRGEQIQASSIKLKHIHDEVGLGRPFFGDAHQVNNSQEIPASVWTKLSWAEVMVNDVSRGAMTDLPVEEKGRYIINAHVEWNSPIEDSEYQMFLYANGAPYQILDSITTPSKFVSQQSIDNKGSAIASLAQGDTLSIYVYATYGGTVTANAHAQIVKGR